MRRLKKLLTWVWLLNKRLFRKPTFLVLLLLIPLLVFGYGFVAGGESGMVTIVLAQEGEDSLAEQVIGDLLGSSQLILFQKCETAREAVDLVTHGKADAAWIFPDAMEERIAGFVDDPDVDNAVVRVVQREEKVMLMLTREVLGGKILDLCSEKIYLNFLREKIPEMAEATDEELLELYNSTSLSGELFSYEQTDGTKVDKDDATGYLMTPLRGLLAVVIVLCGMATAMYYIHDSKIGTFAWLPVQLLPAAELGCQMVSVVDVCVVALISLLSVGMAGPILLELITLILYSLCVAVFSMLLRRLCGSIRGLGVLMPLLVVVMLLVCPVFFDLGALRTAQFIFPPTYFVNAIYNSKYLLYMLAYTGICGGLYWLTGKVLKRD